MAKVKVSQFSTGYHYGATYSGSDMVVFFAFPGYKPVEVGSISTLSYSVYREKKQIRTIGRISPKGITKGLRTISGKMIFTVLHEHIAETLRKEIPYMQGNKVLLMDELPPFDIIVSFGNEYGSSAGLVLQGVTTVDEQKTLSIEEMFTENIFTYLARRLEPMRDTSPHLDQPWDPFSIHTSKFRDDNSELIGRFKLDDLILTDFAAKLKTYDPFLNPAENWESVLPTIDTAYIQMPTAVSSGNNSSGSNSGGNDSGSSNSGSKTKTFNVFVYSETQPPKQISGAEVIFGTSKKTTNSAGIAGFTTSDDDPSLRAGYEEVSVKASGYKDYKINVLVKGKTSVNIYLEPKPSNEQAKMCLNYPDAATTPDKVLPKGYWYEEGATQGYMIPTKNNGKDPQHWPDIEFTIKNVCGQTLASWPFIIGYWIKNWSSVKDNNCWQGLICIGKVKVRESYFINAKTDGNGYYKATDFFDFGKFPKNSQVEIRVIPLQYRGAEADKQMSESLWGKWYFTCTNPS